MNILFIYLIPRSYGHAKYNHGISALSYALKEAGHVTSLLSLCTMEPHTILSCLKDFSSELVLVSYSSNKRALAAEVCLFLSEQSPNLRIVVGGIHPIADPYDAASMAGVHAACSGAGELPLLEVVRRLESGSRDINSIPNLYINVGGRVYTPINTWSYTYNGGPILADPTLFDLKQEIQETGRLAFMAGRGCVFKCSYCIHSVTHQAFSAYPVIELIRTIKNFIAVAGRPPMISFHDDLFPTSPKWLTEFSELYPLEIGIPFYCQMTATCVNPRVVEQLARAGCVEVRMGVEAGDEERRDKVLNKRISNDRFTEARALLGGKGIRVVTLFMIAAPYETRESAERIFTFTRILSPDATRLSIFQPYPGSTLYKLCVENRWVEPYDFSDSLYDIPRGTIPHLSLEEVTNYVEAYSAEFQISSEA